jgi:hypothetical protein
MRFHCRTPANLCFGVLMRLIGSSCIHSITHAWHSEITPLIAKGRLLLPCSLTHAPIMLQILGPCSSLQRRVPQHQLGLT